MRSTPEFILAYVLLQLWGPSMLPAIVALSLHNGAIIGHLIGRFSDEVRLRPDSPRGLNLYGFDIVPRVYGQFLAFLFYRWEVIMRETAILGILGIATLGVLRRQCAGRHSPRPGNVFDCRYGSP